MSILAQCGHGPGQKITNGLNNGFIQGVIKSPSNQRRERLEEDILGMRNNHQNALVMFDPQFYVATLIDPRDGHLSEFEYYSNNSGLRRANLPATKIQKCVKDCLDYQYHTFGDSISYLVSPTNSFDDFNHFWSQITLNMAAESAEYHSSLNNPQPLLISLSISDTAFRSKDDMDEFLDALIDIDVEGFYIIIQHNTSSAQDVMEPISFGNFMYFCHVLSTINQYEIIVGYSDWNSFLLNASGTSHTATGWFQNLRKSSLTRFQPATGGQQARKRYSSSPLLSCPLFTPELQGIFMEGYLPNVLSGSSYDTILQGGPLAGENNWSSEVACLSHWFSLKTLSDRISAFTTPLSRIQEAEQLIQDAINLYTELEVKGISFGPSSGSAQIRGWQESVQEYRVLTGI